MFGVGFSLGKTAKHNQCTESIVSPMAHSPYIWERPRWEIGKSGFPEQTHTRAGVFSQSQLAFEWRKLPNSCFVQLATVLSCLDPPRSLSPALPGMWKEGLFRPNQKFPLRRTSVEWVSSQGNQLHTTHAQRAVGSHFNHPWSGRGLCGTKARVDSKSNPALGMAFVH